MVDDERFSQPEEAEDPPPRESMIRWAEKSLPRMSRLQFWSCLALLLAIFAFGHGALWEHPWDMKQVDAAILWSYAPIPVLVLGCLAWSKRLGLRAFVLDTLELTFLKYAVTFAAALALWKLAPPPPHPEAENHFAPTLDTEELPPTPSFIDPKTTGTLRGRVLDDRGAPLGDVAVYVAEGLEGLAFAPSPEPVRVTNDGQGLSPRVLVAERFQRIEGRSLDGRLHTLVAARAEGALFNIPLISAGTPSTVTVRETHGAATLRCTVHPQAGEAEAQLVIVAHPFHTRTDADGRYELRAVPAGKLTVEALRGADQNGRTEVALEPGATAERDLTVTDRRLGGATRVGL